VLKVLAKDALVQWAANTAADYATDHWDDLAPMQPSERRALIAKAPSRARDKAAARGTQIHAWADSLIAGEPVEIPAEHVGTVESFARWWERSGFTIQATERAVFSDEDEYVGTAYAGRFDALAAHERWGTALIDWKTGRGVYPEFALQLAGYAQAEWHQADDGTDIPAPPVDTLAVVHMTPDGAALHTLDPNQRALAAQRWDLCRSLATFDRPAFNQEA
jgi:hypothetical protein